MNHPQLLTTAALAGIGQVRATMSIHLHNVANEPLTIHQLIELPWYAKPFLHTLKITLDDRLLNGMLFMIFLIVGNEYKVQHSPAISRSRPCSIIVTADIPKDGKINVNFEIEKTLLKYTEYPFDPNRGMDIKYICELANIN